MKAALTPLAFQWVNPDCAASRFRTPSSPHSMRDDARVSSRRQGLTKRARGIASGSKGQSANDPSHVSPGANGRTDGTRYRMSPPRHTCQPSSCAYARRRKRPRGSARGACIRIADRKHRMQVFNALPDPSWMSLTQRGLSSRQHSHRSARRALPEGCRGSNTFCDDGMATTSPVAYLPVAGPIHVQV